MEPKLVFEFDVNIGEMCGIIFEVGGIVVAERFLNFSGFPHCPGQEQTPHTRSKFKL